MIDIYKEGRIDGKPSREELEHEMWNGEAWEVSLGWEGSPGSHSQTILGRVYYSLAWLLSTAWWKFEHDLKYLHIDSWVSPASASAIPISSCSSHCNTSAAEGTRSSWRRRSHVSHSLSPGPQLVSTWRLHVDSACTATCHAWYLGYHTVVLTSAHSTLNPRSASYLFCVILLLLRSGRSQETWATGQAAWWTPRCSQNHPSPCTMTSNRPQTSLLPWYKFLPGRASVQTLPNKSLNSNDYRILTFCHHWIEFHMNFLS